MTSRVTFADPGSKNAAVSVTLTPTPGRHSPTYFILMWFFMMSVKKFEAMVKQRVYLDERMLLQFQQVQLELNSAPFFELDGTGNTLHLDLKHKIWWLFIWELYFAYARIIAERIVCQSSISWLLSTEERNRTLIAQIFSYILHTRTNVRTLSLPLCLCLSLLYIHIKYI